MLKKHKKLKILGHSAMFWSHISADVNMENINGYPKGKVKEGRLAELLREYENLYCDLSAGSGKNAILRDEEYGLRFLEEFSDKVLYGCDICLNIQNFALDFDKELDRFVKEGSMSYENYYKFVRGNAEKLLGL
jgi:predicted TIM-barrel fold metal-dependent hydrolase